MPTDSSPRICILGSYARALVLTTDRIPVAGETLVGRDFRETHGGKGSDMAVQARRLGANIAYVGVVGEDGFGASFLDLMAREGVDTTNVRVTTKRATGVGVIVKDVDARNIIVVDLGANELFGTPDLERAAQAIASATVTLAQLEIPVETALAGLTMAQHAGRTTILNPAPARDLRGLDLSVVDVLTPNETEARLCVGRAPDDPIDNGALAKELLATGVGTVVMTLGEHGAALFYRDAAMDRVPPCPVDVVDSNGAGDSFNAGLAVALAEGRSLLDAARFAGVVAALCCQGWETVPSYRDRAAVEQYLTDHRPVGHQPATDVTPSNANAVTAS